MNVFITGAAGYIGGSVAARLLKEGYVVRGLVRMQEQADRVRQLGIDPVIGTLEDKDILAREAKQADAVINAASSDHLASVETMLNALEGSNKAFVHTSGSSVIGDDARGEWKSDKVFAEDTPVTIVPEKAARAALDKLIIDAAQRGVRSVILCNTMIYGTGLGVSPNSVQIPPLVMQAQKSGIARYVGQGVNVWSNVHIKDVVELYLLALKNAPAGSFYFVENGEASYADIVAAIAKRLKLGAPQSWPVDEAIKEWGFGHAVYSFGSNSRVTAAKARKELAWEPTHTSVFDWITNDMQVATR
ncbi:NAD-dependent epimerase/dehydratase family protein [Herminiimonas fonticola]|uniref:Nucleoside-diphosphate-sugar epimerase n=1 Tax=Herminiimonas fonticola TaxID=303380 RepID=A0A4R6G1N3_9BURK|nr:NAD-dependent epimerase/dehydratase family protein [Herminiimonas fonticola]RBA23496.1 Nucleoside-diphosphate-sugar epimerase [Herminiimonas fonticola]TDN88249.1 nucleoside-diphosphate-sugar epimerase [Herminiimonas fonticola]